MEEEDFIHHCSYLHQYNLSNNLENLFDTIHDVLSIERIHLPSQNYSKSNTFQRFIDFEINKQIEFCEDYIYKNNLKNYLIKYFYPVIIVFGILANVISFLLMVKVHRKRVYKIFPICLAILCLSDCAILIFDCLREYLDIYDIYLVSNSVYSCKITFFLCYLFYSFSSYLYVFISIMRCQAIQDPIKYKQEFSKENQKRIILIFLACLTINIPFLFYSILQKSYGQIKPNGERIVLKSKCQIYSNSYSQLMILDAVFFYFIPFILILFFSIMTLVKLVKKYRFKECASQSGISKSESKCRTCQSVSSLIHTDSINKSISSLKARKNSSCKISLSLMALPIFYLITTLPLIVTFSVQFYNNYFQKAAYYYTTAYFAKTPIYINNSLNVLVFILAGKNLRKELLRIFKSDKLEKQTSLRMTSLNTK